jgi:hypothetical protein
VIKKNIIAFRIPRFITSESKFDFPLLKKSPMEYRRRMIPEITKISFTKISIKETWGEKNNLRINKATAITTSNCIFKFLSRFSADILLIM